MESHRRIYRKLLLRRKHRQSSPEYPQKALRSVSTEHLQNRLKDLRNQEAELLEQRYANESIMMRLRASIEKETVFLERAATEAEKKSYREMIAGYRGRLTIYRKGHAVLFELEKIYKELAAVIAEFRRRGGVLKLL